MNIAEQLKAWRAASKLSQEQAARQLGVSCSTLQKWEQGQHSPRGLYLERVKAIYGEQLTEERVKDLQRQWQ